MMAITHAVHSVAMMAITHAVLAEHACLLQFFTLHAYPIHEDGRCEFEVSELSALNLASAVYIALVESGERFPWMFEDSAVQSNSLIPRYHGTQILLLV